MYAYSYILEFNLDKVFPTCWYDPIIVLLVFIRIMSFFRIQVKIVIYEELCNIGQVNRVNTAKVNPQSLLLDSGWLLAVLNFHVLR
jgi:hypothetical protein